MGAGDPGYRRRGSSYRRAGARTLLTTDGSRLGSISGGCLEEDILARAHRVLATGRPELAIYDTISENDLIWEWAWAAMAWFGCYSNR